MRTLKGLVAGITAALILLTGAAPASAIVGGSDAASAYPSIVSIQEQQPDGTFTHSCHAVVYRDHGEIGLATAAHCLTTPDGRTLLVTQIRLSVGSNLRDGGRIVRVKRLTVKPGWDWAAPGPDGNPDEVDDLAVLIPADTRGLHPIDITDRTDATQVRLLGWGSTTATGEGPLPQRLQQLDGSTIVDPSNCASVLISAGEVCVQSPAGTGPCDFDGGSPALVRVHGVWAVLGIASRQEGHICGTGPSVYTSLSYFLSWLKRALTCRSTSPIDQHQVAPAHSHSDMFQLVARTRAAAPAAERRDKYELMG